MSISSLGYPVKVRDPKDPGGSPASFGKAIVVATPNSFEVEDKATTIPLPNKFEIGTQAIADFMFRQVVVKRDLSISVPGQSVSSRSATN